MEIFGIKFAPLNVPLERRLQTLAAAAWMVTMTFGGIIGFSLLLYLLLFTKLWWLACIYVVWAYIDRDICERGGRPFKWVRSWRWWKYNRDYYPLRFEKVPFVELDPKKNYLFCSFPHGMLSCGAFNAFGTEYSEYRSYFPHHEPRIVTLSQHYYMPLFRELAMALSGIAASAKSIDYLLSRPEGGHACILMVGGAAEAYFCKPGHYRVVLNSRKGFVRLALTTGSPLVPVFNFGEIDLFDQLEGQRLRNIQEFLRKYIGLAPVIPIGRGFFQYSFGIIPRRREVVTVVGRPIDLPKIENPTREQVDEYHKLFVDKLKELFEEQKHNYLKDADEKQLFIV